MGDIVLAGATSGTTTLTPTAVSGTTTLTLPATTDTLVGKTTTDTLTNKTLTGAVMNGTLGATTPSTVVATSGTFSGNVSSGGQVSSTAQLAFNATGQGTDIQYLNMSNTSGQILLGIEGSGGGQLIGGGTSYAAILGTQNARSLQFASNNTVRMTINSAGAVAVVGALSKGSGSFRIDHPLPQLETTHQLVHSFIEGPQADLIYRGKVNLVNGTATVNIDEASTMTEGTFIALCRDVQCFTTNESDWTAVRGSVTGNILTIEAQDNTSTTSISWIVIGERQDKHMLETEWTDENGKVIVEPIKVIDEEIKGTA